MANDLTCKVASSTMYLTVPKLKQRAINQQLTRLTELCGGVTEHDARGAWCDPSGAWWIEDVIQYEWRVFGTNLQLATATILHMDCVEALLNTGERAVMAGNKLYTRRTA